MSSFINDFWTYCKCYEISRNHAIWAALGLLGATINRKVYYRHGGLKFHSNLYTCLVSEQGTGKSTAKDFAEKLFRKSCPEIPVGPSQQSREDIVKFMASDACLNSYKNGTGEIIELRCYVFYIDELKNFISYNPPGMISFLTNIYDRDLFDASTLRRGLEVINNPCLNILACENPDWIVRNLKNDVISGGFSRRFVMVYELDEPSPEPKIKITLEAQSAWDRMEKRLLELKTIVGECKMSPETETLYFAWYIENRKNLPNDKILRGYRRTKHVQLFKVCILITVSEEPTSFLITPDIFRTAVAILDAIDGNMPKLSIAAGRNELALPMNHILEILDSHGGMYPEKRLQADIDKDLEPQQQYVVLRHLESTDRIRIREVVDTKGVKRRLVMTRQKYEELVKTGQITEKKL